MEDISACVEDYVAAIFSTSTNKKANYMESSHFAVAKISHRISYTRVRCSNITHMLTLWLFEL